MAEKQESCCITISPMQAEQIIDGMPSEKYMSLMASFFKVLGDDTRMKIMYAIQNQELCVGNIAEILDMTQSAVSHQLRALKYAGLVKSRRDGKNVYYSLDDEHVVEILAKALIHIRHKAE